MRNVYRDIRFEDFTGNATELAEVFIFLKNAMAHICVECPQAWDILYHACEQIKHDLKEAL